MYYTQCVCVFMHKISIVTEIETTGHIVQYRGAVE